MITVNIHASFNNTIITITNKINQVIARSSGGTVGFKGAKRSSSYAAHLAAEQIAEAIPRRTRVTIKVKGLGDGREAAIKALSSRGVKIVRILDTTPVPFNGCRPPKRRRI